jgi:two-component system NtrC family sensor kinase
VSANKDEMNRLEELLAFFRLSDADLQLLAGLREPFEKHADRLVEAFYQHLLKFSSTRELLEDPQVRDRLLVAQREYLLSLTDPCIDEHYLAERTKIGAVHERVGLDTRWYLGAYSLYFSLLVPVLHEEAGDDRQRLDDLVTALEKRLILDSEIAIHQYIDRREKDLRYLNRELEIAGEGLSREVDEATQSLRSTQARARAAEELVAVATLVSGLAHEVGTPMGVIRGHAEALEGDVEGERAQWRLRMILEQIDRITGIIQSLLNMARPKESVWIALDLEEIAATSVAFLTEKIRVRNVDVKIIANSAPSVSGDPEKLQQVFLNLFINAIDAMPHGGQLTVTIDGGVTSETTVRIADTGHGMDEADLAQIFEPFYTTKDAGHGNGLGLVVVRSIVSDLGGKIEALSAIGSGTEFVIRLPLAAARPATD